MLRALQELSQTLKEVLAILKEIKNSITMGVASNKASQIEDDDILLALWRSSFGLKASEIGPQLGMPIDEIRRILNRLYAAGLVVVTKDYRYHPNLEKKEVIELLISKGIRPEEIEYRLNKIRNRIKKRKRI